MRERALAIGAVRAHVIDARDEFARDFVLPALQAGAMYEGRYPLSTALGRPLIAKYLVEVARIEGATAIAHGGSSKDNDQVRIDASVRAIDPSFELIAPARDVGMTPAEQIEYARARGIPVPASAESPYTHGREPLGPIDSVRRARGSLAGGARGHLRASPGRPPRRPTRRRTSRSSSTAACPSRSTASRCRCLELVESLETIAGTHGIGRVDMVENVVVGTKSREIYEAPAAVALHAAHRELQTFVTPRELERLTSELGVKYADLVYSGLWYSPTREAIDALVAKVQERVTGTIRLKLYKGDCRVVGRQSRFGMYDQDRPIDDQAEALESRRRREPIGTS